MEFDLQRYQEWSVLQGFAWYVGMLNSKTWLNVFKSVSKSCWALAACPHCWPKQHGEAWAYWKHIGVILEAYWRLTIGEIYWRGKILEKLETYLRTVGHRTCWFPYISFPKSIQMEYFF